MPNLALLATIGANADPMRRELLAVQRLANETGLNIRAGIEGGYGGIRSGAIRETIVLLREMSRGNWSRVPGSFTLLLQNLGVLRVLTGQQANAAKILADAWEVQAQKAGLAAIAATRKAAASNAAFIADEENTAATLEQAIADEKAAAAAILNARATQQKAQAAAEAAAAEGTEAAVSLGPLTLGLLAVAAAAAVVWARFKGMKDATAGFVLPAANMDYVAKGARNADQWAEAQKKVTDEVRRTIEQYRGAAAAAERVADATREHFDHLRKMASFEKDPVKRARAELDIERQERQAQLANKYAEKGNLEREAAAKSAQARQIYGTVMSEEEERAKAKVLKERADAAKKYLDERDKGTGDWKKALAVEFGGLPWNMKDRMDKVNASIATGIAEANNAIQAQKDFEDKAKDRKETRDRANELIHESGKSAGEAAKIDQEIPDLQKKNAQAMADKQAELAAEISNMPMRMVHGHVNDLQKVGAYTTGAVDVQKRAVSLLHQIAINTKPKAADNKPFGGTHFGP